MFNKASKINAFYLDNEGKYYGDVTTYILSSNNLEYLLAILNSNMFYYAYNKYYVGGGIEGELTLFTLENFPIPEPDKDTESKLVNLVDNIIDLNKKLSSEKNPNTIEMLNTRIQAVDKAIDKIVYSLYNLTDEEIRVIESE